MKDTKSVRVGLIGLGSMGRNHLRVLSMLKGVDLAFIYDLDAALAARLAEENGTVTGSDLELLLEGVDAVVICTPTVTHSEYLRRAAEKVSNIFVEKPLAHDLNETRTLLDFIAARGLNVQVGFIERFNPAVQQLKSVVDGSRQVISMDFTRTNKLSSRITDVDVVTDLMIHDIDLAIYLNGPVSNIAAQGWATDGMINFASASLTHANGRFSRIQASRITEKKMRSIQATCIDMFVDCELMRKELLVNRQSEIQHRDGGPYRISAIEETIEVRPQEALLSELQAFAAMCQTGNLQGPSAAEALAAADICETIQQLVLA
ncbi:putative dehydrogenase [Sphingomonas naasensis]|uniref:Gfo/Idh/MocA family oxidoreductase n=1 Tax=Sphingomonas naasensis TaxID=1344951 RepID=A0A4S1WSS1_9SPHN|nr:Gfo/Idh/MocA family oxidoreductase [Sphingomonas naasensis]NIJ19293.1 putative dehydrogenase [Sphingomonas naasensis]TGX46468.1 Gfo/Idh/MocA family oxidoreductase [Sphingomonas naasensis]